MEKSASIAELAKALVSFQKEVKTIGYDAKNPFFHSEYATLAALVESTKDILAKNGLVVSQLTENAGEVTTMLLHTSGEYLSSTLKLTPVKNDPQGLGSCITYSRRYAYAAILNLISDKDDDGNAASMTTKNKEVKKEVLEKTPQQKEVFDLGKEAFDNDKSKFISWLNFNFKVDDVSKLDSLNLNKAKGYLLDAIAKKEEAV